MTKSTEAFKNINSSLSQSRGISWVIHFSHFLIFKGASFKKNKGNNVPK